MLALKIPVRSSAFTRFPDLLSHARANAWRSFTRPRAHFDKNPAPNENNPLSPPKRGAGLGFVLVNIGSLTPAPQRGVAPTGLYALSSFEGGEGE